MDKKLLYRRVRIGKLGNSTVIDFAASELVRYLKKIDNQLMTEVLYSDTVNPDFQNIIWVGLDASLSHMVPTVEDVTVDDAVAIEVRNNSGYITGSNAYSVLLAVYRFLKELGCNWVRPGASGERVPQKTLESLTVSVFERASHRYRAVCLEGATAYENVLETIDYLPKVGMNTYLVQYLVPLGFFKAWYQHRDNPYIEGEPISREEVSAMVLQLEQEIAKRGIRYQKVGHGWTCEPFGIDGSVGGPVDKDFTLSEETRSYLAEVNGKRDLWDRRPLETQLCYSNPEVREKIVCAITQYCKNNPHIDAVHVWPADGSLNYCECDKCKEMRPSDWYVMILNELDEMLQKEGLKTKIVFDIYMDLLWEPLEETIKNPDRFILMYAPATRDYGQKNNDYAAYEGELPSFSQNKLEWPLTFAKNLAFLNRWRRNFQGDGIVFDYHLVWPYPNDPGYEACARNLFEDMCNLHAIGLNGMISCQHHRCYFPTALPFYAMAAALWDENACYEAVTKTYYEAAFGADGALVQTYLTGISEALSLYEGYVHPFGVERKGPFCKDYVALKKLVADFQPVILQNIRSAGQQKRDWEILSLHCEYMQLLIPFLETVEQGTQEERMADYSALQEWINANELILQKEFEASWAKTMWHGYVKGKWD